jgi:hypothetical protein
VYELRGPGDGSGARLDGTKVCSCGANALEIRPLLRCASRMRRVAAIPERAPRWGRCGPASFHVASGASRSVGRIEGALVGTSGTCVASD